jgi:hypothetical protein
MNYNLDASGHEVEERPTSRYNLDASEFSKPEKASSLYPKGTGDYFKDKAVGALRSATGKISPVAEGILAGYVAPLDTIGSLVIDTFPLAKWSITKERREQFHALSEEDKKKALIHEGMWAALWVATPFIGPTIRATAKGVGKGTKFATKAFRPKMLPVEDTATWTAKYYGTALDQGIKNIKGLRKAERTAIKDFMFGDKDALRRALTLGKAQGASKAFRNTIKDINGLTSETLERLSPEALRKGGLLEEFGKKVPWTSKGKGAKERQSWLDAIYQREMKYFVGKDQARKMRLRDASPKEMENVLRFMETNTGKAAVTKALETPATAPFATVRRIAEYGEPVFKMFSKVYRPIKDAMGRTNADALRNMVLLEKTLVQRGLRVAKGSKGKTKWIKDVNDDILDRVNTFLNKRDELMQVARDPRIDKEAFARIYKDAQAKSGALLNGLNEREKQLVGEIANTIDDFFTKLYQKRMFWDVQKKFFKAGVTPHGADQVAYHINKNAGALHDVLSTRGSLDYAAKVEGIKNFLDAMKGTISQGKRMGWFNEGADLTKLAKGLTLPGREIEKLGFVGLERKGMAMPFLEGYFPRVYQAEMRVMDDFINALSKDKKAFFTQLRQKIPFDELARGKRKSLQDTIASRVHAQSREMYLHDTITDIAKHAQNLPASWKAWTEHYVSRLMGLPSEMDDWIAKWFNKTARLTGSWDAYRVMNAARMVNDFTYMGFLGLKPFSAMRNMFQPLLMVPADLGGTKDLVTLARGYAFAATPKGKKALDAIGILGEWAPDLETQVAPKLFNVGKKVGGIRLPKFASSRQGMRDASLYMFRWSDEFNRYVSGGAAYVKWQDAVRKVFPGGKALGKAPTSKEVRTLLKKAGVNGRTEVTRAEIESLVRGGQLDQARSIFVKDVVADTQYLYGHADSPLLAHQWGGIGKTGVVFQSWWMNYASALNKWFLTGTAEQRTKRLMNYAVSHTMAYIAMRQLWDAKTAKKAVAFGPIPTDLPTPPIVDLFVKLAKAPLYIGAKTLDGEFSDASKKQFVKILKTGVPMFLPGGLQIMQSGKAGMEEGLPGIAKSIIRYNREPLRD